VLQWQTAERGGGNVLFTELGKTEGRHLHLAFSPPWSPPSKASSIVSSILEDVCASPTQFLGPSSAISSLRCTPFGDSLVSHPAPSQTQKSKR
jgi:hypothetical protein